MSTNGKKPTPSRERIIMTATYYAAISGFYDTSEAAQKANLLTISVMDMANVPGSPLPAGATHNFYICINGTAYMVARYSNEDYRVTPHDQTEQQRQERLLREDVLEVALWYLAEGGYSVGAGPEARAAAIEKLLEERPEDEEEEREEADPVKHPVIRDVSPDPTPSRPPGVIGPVPGVLRQWAVQIGPDNCCEVYFFGYNAQNGNPILVPMDAEEDDDYDENEEE